ncbi:MAG TPA: amidase family protein, partial [Kofleriaceae bacterium]
MDVFDLDATATAELVRSGQVSPRELVDGAIARIERHNAELGAVIIPLHDAARRTAGDPPDGPFRGVPILIKDIGVTIRGVMQTAGLRPLREAGRTAQVSSYLVTALERAGFIVLGTTKPSELGILPSAEPPAWPPTRNPHDLARTSG